ncbi:hypothetical protein [Agrobacterium sp. CNPSo 2736]|uniref:hypothetical protein n=1 Tax=Agrobacterium sp. CNPSo 2736 TaxID=2499627 RepID=UPI001FDF257F|nr:hypothetical protein [Agrobacterium sp. CNPSo 2736]
MNIDGAFTHVDIVRPDCANQIASAKGLLRMLKQVPEQVELNRSEMYLLATAAHPVRINHHFKVATAKRSAVWRRWRRNCLRAQIVDYLSRRDWTYEALVNAGLQEVELLASGSGRDQRNDRYIAKLELSLQSNAAFGECHARGLAVQHHSLRIPFVDHCKHFLKAAGQSTREAGHPQDVAVI